MLKDYAEQLDRIATALGRRYREHPDLINAPGVSVAVKIDPFYYLAPRPAFATLAAKWSGMLPATAEETLLRTGTVVLDPSRSRFPRPLRVVEEGLGRGMALLADFVLASFLDRAFMIHGGASVPPPVGPLRLAAEERPDLEMFFSGKTPLQALAFARTD